MRKLTAVYATIAAFIATVASPAGASSDQPPPGVVTIGVVTANGSGCPPGTTAVSLSNDKTFFTLTYSQYIATVGSGPSTYDRKNCQINLRVKIPAGYTYMVTKTDYRGYANLPRGATAMQAAGYYYAGMSGTVYKQHNIQGPVDRNWEFTDIVPVAAWAPCGYTGTFNINTELRAYRSNLQPTKSSTIQMDSTDHSVNTIYHLAWRRC